MMDIGQALLIADQQGSTLAGVNYINSIDGRRREEEQLRRREEREDRKMQLSEYEILGRIRERQLAELQAQKKIENLASMKEKYPDLADLFDLDPTKAAEVLAAKQRPKERKIIKQGEINYYADTGEPVLAGLNTAPPAFAGTSMDAQTANILLSGDPNSDTYLAAYNIASQPKTQLGPDGSQVTVVPDMSAYRLPTKIAAQLNEASPQTGVPVAQTAPSLASAYAPSGGISLGSPELSKVEGLSIVEGARPNAQDAKVVKEVMGAYQAVTDLMAERKRLINEAEDFTVGSKDAEKIQQNTNQILLKVKNLEQTGALDQGSVDVIAPALGDPIISGLQVSAPFSSSRRSYTKATGGKDLALDQLQSGEMFLKSTLDAAIDTRGYKFDNSKLAKKTGKSEGILGDTEAPLGAYTSSNPAKPTTQKAFEELPKGTPFINPADGKLLRKK